MRTQFGETVPIDLLTCFPGSPTGFAKIYNVNDYAQQAPFAHPRVTRESLCGCRHSMFR